MTMSVGDVVRRVMGIGFRTWEFDGGVFACYELHNIGGRFVSAKRIFDVTECPMDVLDGVAKPRDGVYTILDVRFIGITDHLEVVVGHSVPYFTKGESTSQLYSVKTTILISREDLS